MTEFVPGFSYPAEFNYELPTQTPPGIKQVQLRQFASTSIPNPISTNQEIQIDIPQIDFAFLDPTTTSLCVRGSYTFKVRPLNNDGETIQNSNINNPIFTGNNAQGVQSTFIKYPPISILAARPHAFLGKGWGMFYRYCVYANTNVLTDDITNIGVLQNYMDLLTTGRDYLQNDFCQNVNNPKLAGSNLMAVFPESPASNVANISSSYITGPNNTPVANLLLTDTIYGDGNFLNSELDYVTSNNATVNNFQVGLADVFGDCSSKQFAPTEYDMENGLLTIPFEISLPLFGTLGSGNDKLYPLFVGPTRISLFTEDLNAYIASPRNAFSFRVPAYLQTSPSVQGVEYVAAINTSFDLSATTMRINTVEFVGNYLRCDTSAFQYVLQNLPVEGKMIMRTTSFNYSSSQLNSNASGMVELLIPTRRASQKALLITCSRSDLPDKKYGSVCPNLGQNTCVVINGVQYPQQGINFLEKPHDSFRQTLVSLNLSYSALIRPAISYGNWARLSSGESEVVVPLTPITQKVANADYVYTFLDRRVPAGVRPADGTYNFYNVRSKQYQPVTNTIMGPSFGGQLFSNWVTTQPFWGNAVINDEELISYTPTTQDARMLSSGFTMNNNQWCHVVDTETFGRRGFLNGVSTLSGSIFYQMNIVRPIAATSHIVNFYSFFDAILVMDYTTKQVSWKI
jgi:hypothetical protein